jgi:hypothetical protein
MIRSFFRALFAPVRAWACHLVERVLNWTAIRLLKWSEAISEAADTVGGAA